MFPSDDKYWTDVVDFIIPHLHEDERLLTSTEFYEKFKDRVIDYSIPYNIDNNISWAILHKGRLDEINSRTLKTIQEFFTPVYANDVFVIFSNHKDLPAIGSSSPHMQSYLKNLEQRRYGIKKLKINALSILKNIFVKKIIETKTIIESKNNRECIYLGDYKALTRTSFGYKVFVDTRDMSLTPHILLDGFWEMWITNIFTNLVKEGMNVIDIGANIGYYSLIFASNIGDRGKLFAFEADPDVFDILHKNIEINGFLGRANLINKAVTDKQETIHFNKRRDHFGSSSIASCTDAFLNEQRDSVKIIEVETISLDEYFKNKNMKIDIMKIDAEGSEPFIFDGMKELINKNSNIIIICEFNPHCIYGMKRDPMKFLEDIISYGFPLRYINSNSKIVDISKEELMKKDICDLYLQRR